MRLDENEEVLLRFLLSLFTACRSPLYVRTRRRLNFFEDIVRNFFEDFLKAWRINRLVLISGTP